MGAYLERLRDALSRAEAATSQHAADPRLRGRTYAIPFEDVWQAVISLMGGGVSWRWTLTHADDHDGIVLGKIAGAGLFRFPSTIAVTIGLDENAQTRVDARATSDRNRDFGANARRIHAFFRALDRRLLDGERPARLQRPEVLNRPDP